MLVGHPPLIAPALFRSSSLPPLTDRLNMEATSGASGMGMPPPLPVPSWTR